FSVWSLVVIAVGHVEDAQGGFNSSALFSIRLAASLVALGPIMLAIVMQSRKVLLSKLHYLATHDQLTGAVNRHALHQKAQDLVAEQMSVAVLMIDLDHFKSINDQYGHAAGDEVLVCFAQRVRDCLRPGDVFG